MPDEESSYLLFRDREDAARQLAWRLKGHSFRDPLVLAIPRGGVVVGATMLAALQAIKAQNPHEVIVALPVAPEDSLEQIRRHCDQVVCVVTAHFFWSISDFYEDFPQVDDAKVIEFLRSSAPAEFVGASIQAVA
jgi:predicted phosphoribosyltransferase